MLLWQRYDNNKMADVLLWKRYDNIKMADVLLWKRYDNKNWQTSSVYDCTVEDVEYIYGFVWSRGSAREVDDVTA